MYSKIAARSSARVTQPAQQARGDLGAEGANVVNDCAESVAVDRVRGRT